MMKSDVRLQPSSRARTRNVFRSRYAAAAGIGLMVGVAGALADAGPGHQFPACDDCPTVPEYTTYDCLNCCDQSCTLSDKGGCDDACESVDTGSGGDKSGTPAHAALHAARGADS